MKRLLTTILVTLLLTGCISTQSKTLVAQVAVQLATQRVIAGDVERASRIITISSALREIAGTTRFDSVVLLDAYIRKEINWTKLTPEQTILANLLLDTIRAELEARVGTGILVGDKLLVVSQVALWVESAAKLTMQ